MGELLPVLGGLLLGGLVFHLRGRGHRLPWVIVSAVIVGALASWVNGELEISVSFLAVDVPLALLGILVAGYVHDRVVDGVAATASSEH